MRLLKMLAFLPLPEGGMPVSTASMYACFYAISALLVRHGLSSSKHAGVRSLFNKQYVKTGKIPKDLARIYNDLFERRQEGDYIDFVSFQEAQVTPWIARAEQLIGYVTSLLERKIG